MMNLSLSCYPDRLEYVDQILGFAHDKLEEFAQRCVISFYLLRLMFSISKF